MNQQKLIPLLLLFSIICLTYLPISAQAANSSINMSVETGFEGKVKNGRGFPLKVTLENTGGDFSGDMLVPFSTGYYLEGTKAMNVELPKGSTKTYDLIIPVTSSFDQNQETIMIFDGGWKKGKQVKTTGKNKITYRTIEDEATIGLISENPDRLKELQLVKLNGKNTETISLTKENIPAEGVGLQFFDYLIIDDYPLTTLTDDQQDAIIHWIKQGGVLLAGASTKENHAWGKLQPIMPLKENIAANINDLSFLQTSSEMPLDFSTLKIIHGEINTDANVMLEIEKIPIITNKAVGDGEIWQTAFSLGEEPLSTWKGYSDYLHTLLTMTAIQTQHALYDEGIYEKIYHEFGNTNELLQASNFSVGTLIAIMIGYMIIIIPILYVILRKMDKREYAWWVIPAISVIMSISIFVIGAKDRIGKPQLSEMGVFKINRVGDLSGNYSATLFSNKNGDYELAVPNDEFYGVPVMNQGNLLGGPTNAIMSSSRNLTDYHFTNVEYWSARSIVGKVNKEVLDVLEIDLKLEEEKLKGKITNQLPYDFMELYIWSGSELYELAPVKAGTAINVDIQLKQAFLTSPNELRNRSVSDTDLVEMKKADLQDSLLYDRSVATENLPIVFGYTKDQVIETNVKNKNEKNDRIFLIYQPFKSSGKISGAFKLSTEQLAIDVKVVSGAIYENLNRYNEIALEDGVYEVEMTLPEQLNDPKTTVEVMRYSTNGYDGLTLSFFDYSIGEYVIVDEEKQDEIFKENLGRFISDEGNINVMMEKHDPQGGPYFQFPTFTVEGAVSK